MEAIMKKLLSLLTIFSAMVTVNLFSMEENEPEGVVTKEIREQMEQDRLDREYQRLQEQLFQERQARQRAAREARLREQAEEQQEQPRRVGRRLNF
jgi:hypothetical protein